MATVRRPTRMNGEFLDARQIISGILESDAFRSSVHFSSEVHRSEPILTTGRQMSSYVPDRYRDMRALARAQVDADGRVQQGLTGIELFYRQALFMEDFTDDCPYQGEVRIYFPTYMALNDRQLRGYFTWRTHVREGIFDDAPLSFVYLLIYELLCGIGVDGPTDGYRAIEGLWLHYRKQAPEMDRHLKAWLTDYAVYHGLHDELLAHNGDLAFQGAIAELENVLDELTEHSAGIPRRRKRGGPAPSALPLPRAANLEDRLFQALDEVSTYRIAKSRLAADEPDALCHVACAVFVRLNDYYRKNRSSSLLDTLFGQAMTVPHTMFRSALFHAPHVHEDTCRSVAPGVIYRCERGLWTITQRHTLPQRNAKLGAVMHAVDKTLRDKMGYAHPLKERKGMPKYLQAMIDTEVASCLEWSEAHAPIRIEVDLGKLAGIRHAAALTREALLTDEERAEDAPSFDDTPKGLTGTEAKGGELTNTGVRAQPEMPIPVHGAQAVGEWVEPAAPAQGGQADAPTRDRGGDTGGAADGVVPDSPMLYLTALLTGDPAGRASALALYGKSEDMMVDTINDLLFDVVGDTVIEWTPAGPAPIEDYLQDVKEYLDHDR